MPPRALPTVVPTPAPPPPETITVTTQRVACDGGGVLGHPLVYLDMGQDGVVECGYCDRRFIMTHDHGVSSLYHSPAARPPEAH